MLNFEPHKPTYKISIEVGRSVGRSLIARLQPTIIRLTLRRSAIIYDCVYVMYVYKCIHVYVCMCVNVCHLHLVLTTSLIALVMVAVNITKSKNIIVGHVDKTR